MQVVQVEGRRDYLYDTILEELRRGRTVFLEAYPGYGKTRIAASLLGEFKRIVVLTRTHVEMGEVHRFATGVRGVVYLYGRPKICYKQEKFSYNVCRRLRILRQCNEKITHKDYVFLAKYHTPSEIRDYAKKRNTCMYNGLVNLGKKSNRIVTTYDFALNNPYVFENKETTVLDEAHALLSFIDDIVLEVNTQYVNEIVEALKQFEETKPLAYALRSIYKKKKNPYDFARKLEILLQNYVGGDSEVVEELEKIMESILTRKYVYEDNTIYVLKQSLGKLIRNEPKLVMTAYIPPFLLDETRRKIVVKGETRIKAYIDTDLSSKYNERDEKVYQMYSEKIRRYIRRDTGNMVVFPSYSFMEKVLSYLDISYITEKKDVLNDGEVLVTVSGSPLTEGINIGNIGNVIIVGMPFPSPNPKLTLLSKLYGYEKVYVYIALLRTIQAIGRIRGKGTSYLLDYRFTLFKEKFPSWVEINE